MPVCAYNPSAMGWGIFTYKQWEIWVMTAMSKYETIMYDSQTPYPHGLKVSTVPHFGLSQSQVLEFSIHHIMLMPKKI